MRGGTHSIPEQMDVMLHLRLAVTLEYVISAHAHKVPTPECQENGSCMGVNFVCKCDLLIFLSLGEPVLEALCLSSSSAQLRIIQAGINQGQLWALQSKGSQWLVQSFLQLAGSSFPKTSIHWQVNTSCIHTCRLYKFTLDHTYALYKLQMADTSRLQKGMHIQPLALIRHVQRYSQSLESAGERDLHGPLQCLL